MKKTVILAIILASSMASASSMLDGYWCSLTRSSSGKLVRTSDFTTVLQINNGGDFKMVTIGNTSFEHAPSSKISGYISQGASGAVMQPDLGVKFQEARIDKKKNLSLEFVDGSKLRYAKCESPVYAEKLNEIFEN